MDAKIRTQELLERLRQRGHRLTPQRVAIIRALVEHPGHPSVEQLRQALAPQFPTMSLATVYKTIAFLKEQGEVLELGFGELGSRFDGLRPEPHPHLICTRCGRICDPDWNCQPGLDTLVQALAEHSGYQVSHHRLDLFGLCPDCRKG